MFKQLSNVFVVIFCFIFQYAGTQCPPDSLNMSVKFKLDEAGFPSMSGVHFNDLWGYVDANNNEYAIVGNVDSILIYDVTNVDSVYRVHAVKGVQSCLWRDFKTYGQYAYGGSDQCGEGLLVFDLSMLPDTFTVVDTITDFWTNTHNLYIDESAGRLYSVGTNSSAAPEGMVILDLNANPANPTLLMSINLDTLPGETTSKNYYIHDIYVKNDTAYASHGYLGYAVWDVADVNNIFRIGAYFDLPNSGNVSYTHSSWNTANNDWAYVATEIGDTRMYILDQSDMSNITIDTTWKEPLLSCNGHTNNVPHNPYVVGDLLYISYYQDGVQVLDISTPDAPQRVAYYDFSPNTTYNGTTSNWGVYPFLPSGTILATDTGEGFFVLAQSSPMPIEMSRFEVTTDKNEVKLQWEIEFAQHVSHFEIQHSSDGIQYEKIGTVNFLNDIYEYEFGLNNLKSGTHYFRIKTIDLNKSFDYSDIRSVLISTQQSVTLSPNPADHYVTIQSNEKPIQEISVYNMSGQNVLSISHLDQQKRTINTENLIKGMYVVSVRFEYGIERSRLIIH